MSRKRYRWPCAEPVDVVAQVIVMEAAEALGITDVAARCPNFLWDFRSAESVCAGEIARRRVPRIDRFCDREAARVLSAFSEEMDWTLASAIISAAATALEDRALGGAASSADDAVDRLAVILDDVEIFSTQDALIEDRLQAIARDMRALAAGKLPGRSTAKVSRPGAARPARSSEQQVAA